MKQSEPLGACEDASGFSLVSWSLRGCSHRGAAQVVGKTLQHTYPVGCTFALGSPQSA